MMRHYVPLSTVRVDPGGENRQGWAPIFRQWPVCVLSLSAILRLQYVVDPLSEFGGCK